MNAVEALAATKSGSPLLLLPGQKIAGTPFVVVAPMRHGGMGEVHEVVHSELDRHFALKCLHERFATRRDLVARMRFEARLLATIRHPNVVQVVDLGQLADGRPYFVMELLRGRDLRRELYHRGPLPVPVALMIAAQALDGLSAAHAAGAMHRDIKLDNLFREDDGTIKVIDFGVAKRIEDSKNRDPGTEPSGTLRYMSPEQCSLSKMDARGDLYSMGMVLYELIAGRGPFDELRGSPDAMRLAHCKMTPPALSTISGRAIDPSVEAALRVALAKAPENRFQSAEEMATCLRALAGERRRSRDSIEAIPAWWNEPIDPELFGEAPSGDRHHSEVFSKNSAATNRSATIELSRMPTYETQGRASLRSGTRMGVGA